MLGRQFLHAYELSFRRPSDNNWLTFNAELPVDLSEALSKIGLADLNDLGTTFPGGSV
jgi:hypothetical protein